MRAPSVAISSHAFLSLHPRQTNPGKYPSIGAGFSITAKEGGMRGLVRGWVPTLCGYSIQGAAKFGLYGKLFLFLGGVFGR